MKKTALIAVLVLCAGGILAMAQGPPQTWTWTVAIANFGNLAGDGNVYATTPNSEGDYLVNVRVLKQTKSKYLFRLHIWNGSERYISVPGVELSSEGVYLHRTLGLGYFPQPKAGCTAPEEHRLCGNFDECGPRLQKFLALSHPVCGYASVRLEITVPLDIERLQPGRAPVTLNGGVRLYIENTNASFNQGEEPFHNMDALNLATSPISIQRTAFNEWELWVVSTDPYLNYGEFYFGYWRNRPGDNKISMLVDGSFTFHTIWTRQ